MSGDGLLRLHEETVRPEWLDYNGHLNLAYYLVAFDHASDKFLHHVGLGEAYTRAGGGSIFVVETHLVYRREVLAGAPLAFTTQLLGHDGKRLHFIHHMHHAQEGFLAAANEIMALHVGLETRRAAPMPKPVLATLKALQASHDRLPRPPEAGRSIGMKKPG
jgi:acyl-CoA thioester hydrolase